MPFCRARAALRISYMATLLAGRNQRVAERRFYTGTAFIMLAAVFLGFSRTFFLKHWFPEAAALAPARVATPACESH